MQRISTIKTFLFSALLLGGTVSFSQSVQTFQDDPIAAMLDSLVQLNIFEKTAKPSPGANKFNYAHDSVPRFSDAVIAQRLSKMDGTSPFDFVYNDQVKSYIEMYAHRKRTLMSK